MAVTVRKQPDLWCWAVVGPDDSLLAEGGEATQEEAKAVAVAALERATSRQTPEDSCGSDDRCYGAGSLGGSPRQSPEGAPPAAAGNGTSPSA